MDSSRAINRLRGTSVREEEGRQLVIVILIKDDDNQLQLPLPCHSMETLWSSMRREERDRVHQTAPCEGPSGFPELVHTPFVARWGSDDPQPRFTERE